MSEYGCITNTRTFAETDALYQPDMTVAFSGGLVYEYAQEENNYGLVTISGDNVTPVGQQFSDLENAMKKVQTPSGDGGCSPNNPPQECPGQSDNWQTSPFTGSALPATPSGAMKYFKNGAGKGPGLSGSGSQEAPGGSSATASSNAGQVTATYGSGNGGSSTSSGAAVAFSRTSQVDLAPLVVCGVVVTLSFVFGAAVL